MPRKLGNLNPLLITFNKKGFGIKRLEVFEKKSNNEP